MKLIVYYKYKFIDNKQVIIGDAIAKSKNDLIQKLHIKQKNLIYAKKRIKISSRILYRDLKIFSQIISKYISAGLKLFEAIEEIKHYNIKKLESVVQSISNNIQNGMLFSEALSMHKEVFNSTYINLIKTGEKIGNIKLALQELTTYLSRMDKVSTDVSKALRYPKIILFILLGSMIFMKILVMDNIVEFMESMEIEQPTVTKFIINTFFNPYFLIALPIFIIIFSILVKTIPKKAQTIFHKKILTLPYFGDLIQTKFLFYFSYNMHILIKNSVNLVESLQLCKEVSKNLYIIEVMHNLEKNVINGDTFSTAIKKEKIFPEIMSRIIEVSEKSSGLSESLKEISELYYQTFTEKQDYIIKMIEPTILIFVGSVIILMVSGTLLPMYSAVSNIGL